MPKPSTNNYQYYKTNTKKLLKIFLERNFKMHLKIQTLNHPLKFMLKRPPKSLISPKYQFKTTPQEFETKHHYVSKYSKMTLNVSTIVCVQIFVFCLFLWSVDLFQFNIVYILCKTECFCKRQEDLFKIKITFPPERDQSISTKSILLVIGVGWLTDGLGFVGSCWVVYRWFGVGWKVLGGWQVVWLCLEVDGRLKGG